MLGKIIEFKPLAPAGQKTVAATSEYSLAEAIIQRFLDKADAPPLTSVVPARIFAFNQDRKVRDLKVISLVQVHLRSPFTLAFWLASLRTGRHPSL